MNVINVRENWCKCILIPSISLKQIANIKKKRTKQAERWLAAEVMGLLPHATLHVIPLTVQTLQTKWHSTDTTHKQCYCSGARAGRGAAAARMGAIELAAHYQSNLSSSSTTAEAAFSICSALFTDASAEKTTTIWWQPDWLPIDAVLIFALVLLYVLKKMMEWISSTCQHTHTHKDRHKHPRQLFVLMQSPISVYFQN